MSALLPAPPTLRRLTIFDAVVQTGSLGGAALQVGLAQPSVSHALDKLEREVGGPLLVRGPSGSFTTPAGRLLHRRVERMLRQIETALEALPREPAVDPKVLARNLTTPQVRVHVAVARHGSFRAAAQALGVAEPTLHRAARELERMVGALLYRRTSVGMSATAQGRALGTALQLALYEIDQALDELAAERGGRGGRVAVGCLPLMPKPVLARTVGLLLRDYPEVKAQFTEASHDILLASLRGGDLDLIVGALRWPRLSGDVVERALFKDPHLVMGRAGHPLTLGSAVPRETLATYPWVAPTAGTPRRAFVEDLFAKLPRRPRIITETNALSIMTAILTESDCLTLLSRAQARHEFQNSGLAEIPVELEAPDRSVGVTTRAGWLPTAIQRRFLTLLRDGCRPLGGEHV